MNGLSLIAAAVLVVGVSVGTSFAVQEWRSETAAVIVEAQPTPNRCEQAITALIDAAAANVDSEAEGRDLVEWAQHDLPGCPQDPFD